MNDPLLVRGFEGLGDLLRNGQGLVCRDGALCNALREVVALDEFHHERGHVARALEAVDRRDVWVIERREDFGFALESRQAIRVASKRRRQHFDRHGSFQVGVGGFVDFPHPADADERGDLVDAESSAGSEAQTVGSIAFMVARTWSLLGDGLMAINFHIRSAKCSRPDRSPLGDVNAD